MREIASLNTHVGESNYSNKKIQPWDIWAEYRLDPWDADIVKRVLRSKGSTLREVKKSKILDYQKIIHICNYKLEILNNEK